MKKLITATVLIIAGLAVVYFSGPRIRFEKIVSPEITLSDISLDSLNRYVHKREANLLKLKPDNQSRIIWADSIRQTKYSLVYLHGFSASPMESYPVHMEFARRYGMNIYLPLLSGHGLDDPESFLNLQPNELIRDAKEAIAIGQLIGEDVIVMSCSTGSTLAIYLAAANKELIDALIMYSPNLELYDPAAKLITGPWGKNILLGIAGPYHRPKQELEEDALKYWTTTYRNEGVIALQSLLQQTMTDEVFEKVNQPYFAGFYYKDEEKQDKTISVAAIRMFDAKTTTPDEKKVLMAFPNAGEHVIANPLKSRSVEEVRRATYRFAEKILGIRPVPAENPVDSLDSKLLVKN